MVKKIFCIMAVVVSVSLADAVFNNSNLMVQECAAATQNHNSDGYIYKGTITLRRLSSGIRDTFYLFEKRGVSYVSTSKRGPYYKLERRMKINNMEYVY